MVELNEAGTDYVTRGNFHEEEFSQSWLRLQVVLEDARHKLTRKQLLAEWPADWDKPDPATLWKWLQRGVSQGLVCQTGTGRKHAAYRYWLPEMEAKWQADPLYLPDLPGLPDLSEREVLREATGVLDRRGRRAKEAADGAGT